MSIIIYGNKKKRDFEVLNFGHHFPFHLKRGPALRLLKLRAWRRQERWNEEERVGSDRKILLSFHGTMHMVVQLLSLKDEEVWSKGHGKSFISKLAS